MYVPPYTPPNSRRGDTQHPHDRTTQRDAPLFVLLRCPPWCHCPQPPSSLLLLPLAAPHRRRSSSLRPPAAAARAASSAIGPAADAVRSGWGGGRRGRVKARAIQSRPSRGTFSLAHHQGVDRSIDRSIEGRSGGRGEAACSIKSGRPAAGPGFGSSFIFFFVGEGGAVGATMPSAPIPSLLRPLRLLLFVMIIMHLPNQPTNQPTQ